MQDATNNNTDTIAFHGDSALKHRVIQRIRDKRDAGDITKDVDCEVVNGVVRGNASTVTINAFDYERFPTELGLPRWLAELEDVIFRGLPEDTAQAWPELVLDAITPGDDMEHVINRLGVIRAARLFKHAKSLHGKYDEAFDKLADFAIAAISLVVDLHHGLLQGESKNVSDVVATTRNIGDVLVAEIQAEKHKPRTDRLIGLHALWRCMCAASASALWTTGTEVTFEAAILTVTACAINPGDKDLRPKDVVLMELWKIEANDLLKALRRSQPVIH